MSVVKSIVDFYIRSSIHVAFAVVCWIGVTDLLLGINSRIEFYLFAFGGTVIGYNAIKFISLLPQHKHFGLTMKLILIASAISLVVASLTFMMLSTASQVAALLSLVLVIGYAVPLLGKWPNFRNIGGLKIYIVALCYVVVTVLMPVLNNSSVIDLEVLYLAISRFLMILVLVLIFDIIDLNTDSPFLKTIPQTLGLRKAKVLASVLLAVLFATQLLWISDQRILEVNVLIAAVVAVFLWFATPKRPSYYTQLYLESLPMLWLLLLHLCKNHYF